MNRPVELHVELDDKAGQVLILVDNTDHVLRIAPDEALLLADRLTIAVDVHRRRQSTR